MALYIRARIGKVWWMRYRDRNGKRDPGIDGHRRLAGGAAETAGTASGQGRQHPRHRPERRATTISRSGRTFSWRTTPSRRSAQKRRTKRIERAALHLKEAFGQRAVGDITADDIEHVSSAAAAGASSGQDRKRSHSEEIGSSRRRSIRNCGFFAV